MHYIKHKVQAWSNKITTKPYGYKFFALFFWDIEHYHSLNPLAVSA